MRFLLVLLCLIFLARERGIGEGGFIIFTSNFWRRLSQGALPLGLADGALAQRALADDDGETTSGFNIFLLIVPIGVLALLRWVFSLGPKMDDAGEGYASITLRGRDSAEKLQARIEAMEEEMRLEELREKKLLEARSSANNQGDILDDDEDLYSADLQAQLRAARKG